MGVFAFVTMISGSRLGGVRMGEGGMGKEMNIENLLC